MTFIAKASHETAPCLAHQCIAEGDRMNEQGPIRVLAADDHPPRLELSEREREVLELVAKGLSNREIANVLGRSEETIKVHLKNIFDKLGVQDRTEAVMTALERGILHIG